jgi:hypothetical protein
MTHEFSIWLRNEKNIEKHLMISTCPLMNDPSLPQKPQKEI